MTRGWLARHPVAGFLAFSHGWTFGFYALAALVAGWLGTAIWAAPAVWAFYLGGAGVMLGGIAMSYAHGGRAGLRDLGRRCVDPRRIPLPWWAALIVFYPAITLAAAGIAAIVGLDAGVDLDHAAARLLDMPAVLAFLAFILVIGPLPEEIGWRGFLLDRLLEGRGALVTSLWLALAWWSWHVPLPWLPGYFDAFDRAPPGPLASLIALLPTTILYTFLYLNTARSVLAAIVFHWLGNLTGQLMLPSDDVRLVRLVLEYGAALAVAVWWLAPRRRPRSRP